MPISERLRREAPLAAAHIEYLIEEEEKRQQKKAEKKAAGVGTEARRTSTDKKTPKRS